MDEINDLIANATDAQLAHLATFFAEWMQTPECDDVVLRVCFRLYQEIRFRMVEDRQLMEVAA